MKFFICCDNHFCEKSSVIQGRGEKYSSRLENQMKSLEWVASFGLPVIHLGDFFNNDVLTAEEISCLHELKKKIDFSKWTFLQGNHGYNGGFDVMGIFENQVISKPTFSCLKAGFSYPTVLYLPFSSKEEEIREKTKDKTFDLILGHIGVEGIPFGATGFDSAWLSNHCKLFLNGHLHNRHLFNSNCWNIGSLTAQNFSDNCIHLEKGAAILDTETLSVEFVQNPHAFNFYKMSEECALSYIFPNIKTSCISVICTEAFEKKIRERLKDAYYLRVNVVKTKKEKEVLQEEFKVFSVDYLNKFRESFIEKQGESAVILDELSEVCNG